MIIYSPVISPRLQFIARFIGTELTGKAMELISDRDLFQNASGPKINYSNQPFSENQTWIQPHTLLFEKGIRPQAIECFNYKNSKAFFKSNGDLPFDIFSASFYLLSRYEEWLPHQEDMYGRFAHKSSLAYKEGFLQLPLVNIWLMHFKELLQQNFPSFPFIHSPFTFLPTYDIDEAWSYKFKTTARSIGATLKNLMKGEWGIIRERKKVRAGKIPDPFDAYQWMDELHKKYGLAPRYFFLVAERTGRYDRNVLPNEKAVSELIRSHSEKYSIGVHPSWQSGDDPALLQKEIALLTLITGKKIDSSRQHFIRFTLPQTYRQLMDVGIREDFSMGYGSINGFRASVATPYYWYDLEKEENTELFLYPFCFMDANCFFEQKLSPEQALEEMRVYYREVKAVNGTFISIWHNTFLGTGKLFRGWREAYEEFIKEVAL